MTGRLRLSLTTAALAVVVATTSTIAGRGEPASPAAGAATLTAEGRGHDPVIHVPAVRARQALVKERKGTPRLPASALAGLDIPPTAMLAYQRAAAVMAQADGSCRLSWTLLAAIGRVESDHGRYAGALLLPDGTSSPPIRGVALDGRGPVARIRDTDGGSLDGDRTWDRAVGPMQFLPSTWSVVGVDADGDGVRSPDDLDDAALAAGLFLCSGSADLGTAAGRQAAVFRYNPSRTYVASVLAVEQAYRDGDFGVQGQPLDVAAVQVVLDRPGDASGPAARGRTAGDRPPARHPAADGPTDASDGPGGSTPGPQHAGGASTPAQPGDPTTSAPADPATTHPDGPSPGAPTPNDPSPSDPTPSDPPSTPTDPTPTDPSPTDPSPSDPPPTEPSSPPPTDPTPDLVTLSGVLARCGAGATCLGDTLLDVGDEAFLAGPAAADFDGDGATESNAAEIDGLVGTDVSVQAVAGTTPAVVVAINQVTYRPAP